MKVAHGITENPPSAAFTFQVWNGAISRGDCLQTIVAMTNAISTVGGVLRSGTEVPDLRLRSCAEHILADGEAQTVVAALKTAAATIMHAMHWQHARLDGPKFCSYAAGGFFRAHRDRSEDPLDPSYVRDRAMSFTCALNDSDSAGGLPTFDGGALIIYIPQSDGTVTPVNVQPPAGSIVTFRADLMHEVRPIRSGKRFASVAWLYNPDGTIHGGKER